MAPVLTAGQAAGTGHHALTAVNVVWMQVFREREIVSLEEN